MEKQLLVSCRCLASSPRVRQGKNFTYMNVSPYFKNLLCKPHRSTIIFLEKLSGRRIIMTTINVNPLDKISQEHAMYILRALQTVKTQVVVSFLNLKPLSYLILT
jgi:hypothetical protein